MDLNDATDPFELFDAWFQAAQSAEPCFADAMALATASAAGKPSVRTVLLKGADRRGFVFYTNMGSRKGQDLTANPQVALCFHWKSLSRQILIEGAAERVGDDEADTYFASRPRDSRIGAWASDQSRPLDTRATLMARVAEVEARFPDGTVPRPPYWTGTRVVPQRLEFWQEGSFRLHDRVEFQRTADGWTRTRLYP